MRGLRSVDGARRLAVAACLLAVLAVTGCGSARVILGERGNSLTIEGDAAILRGSPLPANLDVQIKGLPASVTMLVLDSEGAGPLPITAATLIRHRDMTTVVRRACWASCALLFQAGTTRILGREATLVYQLLRPEDAAAYGLPDINRDESGDLIAALYYSYGLHQELIRRAQRGPVELKGQQAVDAGAATRWGGVD